VKGGLDLPQVRQLVEESRRFPSLWGAVRFLLIDQLEDDPPRTELLTAICFTPNNVDLTNLAIDTLLVYAGQSVASCSEVERYAIQTLLPKSVASAGMVAAQVGYQLILADILEGCLLSSVEETNQLATLYTFYLWSHRPEEDNGRAMAVEVFNRIYGHVKKTLSPRGIVKLIGPGLRRQLSLDQMKGIRPLIELSILLVGYQYHQPEGVREPEGIREVGDVMLSFLNRIPGGPIRWLVFQSMKHFAASTAHEAVGNAGVINLRTLRPFFDRPLDDPFRKECVDLIDYLDPYGTPVATIADKLFPLAQEEDAVLYYVLEYVLMPRVGTDYEGVYSFAQRLYREGNIQSKFAALRVFTMVTYMELGRPYVKQEHFDFCQEMVFGCLEGEEMRVRFSWKESKDSPLELRTFGTNHLYMLILYECFNRQGGALACVDRALNLKVDRIDPLEITQDLTTTLKEYGLKDPQMLQEFQNDLLGADPHTVLEVKVILDLGWAVLLGSGTRRTNVDPIMVTLRRWSMVEDGAKLIAMSLTLSVIRSCFPREVDQFLAESSSELRRTVAANLMLVPVAKMISISYQALSGMVQQFPALRQAVIPPLIWHGLHGTSVDLCAQECGRNIADYKVLYDLAEGIKGTLPGMHQEQSRQ
jgi:hypothetical protein